MNIRVKTLGKLPSVEIYSILILKVQNKRSSDIFYNISIIWFSIEIQKNSKKNLMLFKECFSVKDNFPPTLLCNF